MPDFLSLQAFALVIGLGAIALIVAYTLITGSPPVPTSHQVWRTFRKLLPRRLPVLRDSERAVIYELGAGWGGNAFKLADTYPEHRVIGIERSPLPWLVARLRHAIKPRPNLEFRRGNFMTQDLSDAVLLTCYLSSKQMAALGPKLDAELTAGALVLSNTFAIPDWRPADSVFADDMDKSPVYLYEAPATPDKGAVADASQAASAPDS